MNIDETNDHACTDTGIYSSGGKIQIVDVLTDGILSEISFEHGEPLLHFVGDCVQVCWNAKVEHASGIEKILYNLLIIAFFDITSWYTLDIGVTRLRAFLHANTTLEKAHDIGEREVSNEEFGIFLEACLMTTEV